jgi:ABC-type amino acid transport substrate-binding protein
MTRIPLLINALVLALVSTLSTADSFVIYPQPGEVYTKHHRYPVELLKLALSYHETSFTVEPSENFMTQGRAIRQLQQGIDIDVMWTMTSQEREERIRPIRIPIYKGLIGWRLFLTTPKQLENQPQAWSFEELKRAKVIQGHDWPDSTILAKNSFNIIKVPNYEGLFQILSLNRAELFPRSIIEIWDELENHKNSNIVVEPNTLISYPTATYFFVTPKNIALASIIEEGLEKARNDGQFDALFHQYHADMINKANLSARKHYRLRNPLLPEETPLGNKTLWFGLDSD